MAWLAISNIDLPCEPEIPFVSEIAKGKLPHMACSADRGVFTEVSVTRSVWVATLATVQRVVYSSETYFALLIHSVIVLDTDSAYYQSKRYTTTCHQKAVSRVISRPVVARSCL